MSAHQFKVYSDDEVVKVYSAYGECLGTLKKHIATQWDWDRFVKVFLDECNITIGDEHKPAHLS